MQKWGCNKHLKHIFHLNFAQKNSSTKKKRFISITFHTLHSFVSDGNEREIYLMLFFKAICMQNAMSLRNKVVNGWLKIKSVWHWRLREEVFRVSATNSRFCLWTFREYLFIQLRSACLNECWLTFTPSRYDNSSREFIKCCGKENKVNIFCTIMRQTCWLKRGIKLRIISVIIHRDENRSDILLASVFVANFSQISS